MADRQLHGAGSSILVGGGRLHLTGIFEVQMEGDDPVDVDDREGSTVHVQTRCSLRERTLKFTLQIVLVRSERK